MTANRLLAAFLLAAVAAPATRLPAQSRIGVGVEFGYTRAGLTGSEATGISSRSGALGGIFLSGRLSRTLALTIGPNLAAKGGTAEVASSEVVIDLVGIDLPLLLRARIPLGALGLLAEVGAMPGIRIGCNAELRQPGVPFLRTPCNDPALSQVGDFALWDVAAVAGIGIGIPVAGSDIGLKVRVSRGFIPVIASRSLYNRSGSIVLVLPF
jgi:hypothetical protein